METKIDLKATIEKLEVGKFVDLEKTEFTASAVRKAVQRIYETPDNGERRFGVSETAYPSGTRVTRLI